MFDAASPSGRRPRRARLGERLLILASTAMVGAAVFGRILLPVEAPPPDSARVEPATTTAQAPEAGPTPGQLAWILDPAPALGTRTPKLGQDAASTRTPAALTVAAVRAQTQPVQTPRAQPELLAQTVPLPKPRPSDLLRQAPEPPRLAERPATPRQQLAAREDAQGERSFFETVFGGKPATGSALAYAPQNSDAIDPSPRRALGLGPAPTAGGRTAIYDISARTVTLPNGERLEAHSGLGPLMDDPRYVNLRARGPTPPGTYDLTEREALFHGVRAIRLTPVGGSGAVFNRVGLLAHHYLRGPSGESSGCISFRNYNRFLQAYLRGEVQRVVVVAGSGKDRFPSFAEALSRRAGRTAQAGDGR